jgi:hypothetical protein
MKIELLYFDGCLAYQTALKYVEEVTREKKLDVRVEMIKIKGDEHALRTRFLGSPTVRLNGLDIEPSARGIKDFPMRCRLYLEDDKVNEWPSKKMIRRAIDEALKGEK